MYRLSKGEKEMKFAVGVSRTCIGLSLTVDSNTINRTDPRRAPDLIVADFAPIARVRVERFPRQQQRLSLPPNASRATLRFDGEEKR